MSEHVHRSGSTELNLAMFKIGCEILGLRPGICASTKNEFFRRNFKYDPARCAYIFQLIKSDDVRLPSGFQPKHVLWTLYFLTVYPTERRMCLTLKADRGTIRKFVGPTIDAIAWLSSRYVRSFNNVICAETFYANRFIYRFDGRIG
jgi:hypothetical protein